MKNLIITVLTGIVILCLAACSGDNSSPGTAAEKDTGPPLAQLPPTEADIVVDITETALQPAVPVTGDPDHESMLASNDPQLAANKRIAYDMWRTLVDARDVEAARQYIDENYIQHNPIANTGFAGLQEYFSSQGERVAIPERIQRPLVAILAERDLVAMAWVDEQTYPDRPGETYTTTIFNMYRIANGKIVEHWDHGTLPPGETPRNYVPPVENTDHATSLASPDPALAANKRLVYDMWRILFDGQQVEAAPRFLAEDYIQHNPIANTGLQGFLAFFRPIAQPRDVPDRMANFIEIVAEGDKVVLASLVAYQDANGQPYFTTWFDMYVIENSMLAEHWDTMRFDLPQRAAGAQ